MRGALFAIVFVGLAGCPKAPLPTVPVWESIPRLPAPKAGSYNRSKESPPDAAVATLVENRPWDASLSGAAAGLALDLIKAPRSKGLTRWDVRESAWTAGYAYPVLDAKAWYATEDGSPPPQLFAWLQALSPTDDVGLVRARGQDGDLWVALKGAPLLDIGRLPRQLAQGGTLELPALSGASFSVADANGVLRTGSLDEGASLVASSRGEWLVQIEKDNQLVALFPVYVGIVPPELGLIESTQPVIDAVDAISRVETLLSEVRMAYGVEGLQRDFMLDAGARSLLSGGSSSTDGVAASLGLARGDTAMWECQGTTIEACLDRMIWRPENRLALLHAESALGLAATVDDQGVRLVGILGRTE